MSLKSVIFYGIQSEFFPVAYKLVEKIYASRERILFLCDSEDEMSFYNSKLWTTSKLSFIPSGNRRTVPSDDSTFCYVWFSTKLEFLNNPTTLIHNGLNISDNAISKFQRVVDIFNLDSIESANARSKFYSENGFYNQKLWIQENNSWKQGMLKV